MLMKTICNLAFFLLPLWKVMKNVHWVCGLWMVLSGDQQWYDLESMDAAGRVPHLSPTWLPVRRCRVWVFFFFFFSRIRADSASIRAKPGWFGQNRVISAGDWNGWNRPKLALNLAGTAEILTSEVFRAFFFFCFVNQGIVMCFLRIF